MRKYSQMRPHPFRMNFCDDCGGDDCDDDPFIFCFLRSKDYLLNLIIPRNYFHLGTGVQAKSQLPRYQNQQHSEYDRLYDYEKRALW